MGRLGGQRARAVARRQPRGVAALAGELGLHLLGVLPPAPGASGSSTGWADERRPEAVEIDQLLRDRLALGRVGVQQRSGRTALEHRGELPAEVEAVLHRDVHPLAGLGASACGRRRRR